MKEEDNFPVCEHCGCVWANCNGDALGWIGCPVANLPEEDRNNPDFHKQNENAG